MPEARPAATVAINAPLDAVWAVMTDIAAYGEWNPFCYRADCPSPPKVGDPIKLYVRWSNGRTQTSPERISIVEPPAQDGEIRRATLGYVYEGLPAKLGLVKGRRLQRLSQEPGGPTIYDTVEEFAGPLVALAGPERVREGFQRHADALKVRVESLS
ncbi:SRPBCC domain-containing protein [Nocardioides marmoriginsengisoli]|uniref:SRPBCC domain-containing protein n=1 Tax=Nocardioides marmoriginsengisoli TaxID=661483 RepID=A0A3N0CGH0_9ACTN|nr:SRPBCC domain-containing protein [Nocardioides marmoriginsengisoli]RNL62321.1 SRPBCC domain-containing protein [Nocardioides marmoriginsengisoli]